MIELRQCRVLFPKYTSAGTENQSFVSIRALSDIGESGQSPAGNNDTTD